MSLTAEATEVGQDGRGLPKACTGIRGLDEITHGGLPRGRTTLVTGGPGCGKTLLAMQFLVRGALDYDEPGVFMAFEENADELAQNVASLGFDLPALSEQGRIRVQHVFIDRSEIEETGEYDLEGLFVRLGHAIDSIGAQRVVLDTLESLFTGFSSEAILRAELRRLFRWLKERGVTAIVTAERGASAGVTRHGLEEYVSDCVLMLDHRVRDQVSTRHLQIVKYRGSSHGTNEYPFLIDSGGISVLPVTSLGLDHLVSSERVSTGIPRLDGMLGGKGYYRGSSILVSGTAGTGKTSIAAHAVEAACRRGETVLYFAFEESPDQLIRNMRSIGIDLQPWIDQGLLHFHAARPTLYGLEMHLASMLRAIEDLKPALVVLDPITNFISSGTQTQVKAMLMRMIDTLKGRQISGFFTSLTGGENDPEQTEAGVSSLMDTWILLKFVECSGERNRGLYVLKSRGMAHSNQVREFLVTDHGVELVDVYLGPSGVLTGTARYVQEAREREEAAARQEEVERRKRELERTRAAMERQIEAVRAEYQAREEELTQLIRQQESHENLVHLGRGEMGRLRFAEEVGAKAANDGGAARRPEE